MQKVLCLVIILNVIAIWPIVTFTYRDSFREVISKRVFYGVLSLVGVFLLTCVILLHMKTKWFYYPFNLYIIVLLVIFYGAFLTVLSSYLHTDLVLISVSHIIGVSFITIIFCYQNSYDLFPWAGFVLTIFGVVCMYGLQCFVYVELKYKTYNLIMTALMMSFIISFMLIDVFLITAGLHIYFVPMTESGLAILVLFCDIITGIVFVPIILLKIQ